MLRSEERIEIVSADIGTLLSSFNEKGIEISALEMKDELTATMVIRHADRRAVQKIAERRGAEVCVLRRSGLHFTVSRILRRPLLLIGLLLMFGIGVFLPTRIFFFRVEGNVNVPTRLILEQAAECGISFGASRREVRSEKVKNALLEAMPQLQWAGVNTSGCVATISVREREVVEQEQPETAVTRIVAVRDALIESVTVTAGNALCTPGQAVRSGEVLISGYTDCGISIRADRAVGEIFGRTERELTLITPRIYTQQAVSARQETKYSLLIGKKRINFYKGSGISPATCDRMYEENYVTLPGGFQLPIAIVTETWTYYDCAEISVSEADIAQQLYDYAARYLSGQMVAGQIVTKEESIFAEDGLFQLFGQYACREMIGREQKEEIITPYGKHD